MVVVVVVVVVVMMKWGHRQVEQYVIYSKNICFVKIDWIIINLVSTYTGNPVTLTADLWYYIYLTCDIPFNSEAIWKPSWKIKV